jgi:hypothetical protein
MGVCELRAAKGELQKGELRAAPRTITTSCKLRLVAPGCQISSCELRLEIFTNSVQLRAAKFRSQKIHNLFTI